jgi:hypothetical protein
MRRRLEVIPVEHELMRFHVESQQGKQVPPYFVDLAAVGGLGFCACPHYEHRIYPLLKAQLASPWKERRYIDCIHLLDARAYFMAEIIHHLSERLEAEPKEKIVFGTGESREKEKAGWQNFWLQKFFNWKPKDG